ncbi:MAG: hypothetical protein MJZ34_08050 [Paludibacteraceae bacterium]|nr:hypothetical protein [Paludibacteraceae bacterium]
MIELKEEFYSKYVEKLLGNFHSNDIKEIIKEIYETAFKDGEKFVYQMRYGNANTNESNGTITYVKCPKSNELEYGKKYKCYRKNGGYLELYYHGIPPGEVKGVLTEHSYLSNSDWWQTPSEFEWFEEIME